MRDTVCAHKFGAARQKVARAAIACATIALALPGSAVARESSVSTAAFEAATRELRAAIARKDVDVDIIDAPAQIIEKQLGEALYSDRNLSLLRNQSCASCHALTPATDLDTGLPFQVPGFVDSGNVERGTPVSNGSVAGAFGKLNAPSVGYAAFSPPFRFNAAKGQYIGGQFWNGRASTLADQAAQPFLNPAEMAMPSKAAVVERLKQNSLYQSLFLLAYGIDISQAHTAGEIDAAYAAMTKAIAAFERKSRFTRFTSKFDYFVAGRVNLATQESLGLQLFIGSKTNCATCHIPTPTRTAGGKLIPALFTNFTYQNIGVPRNLSIPGDPAPDGGLGARADIAARNPQGLEIGKHKVMSLRNIAITPPYGHNGVFRTLEQITHFYNTRDTLGRVPNNHDPGFGVTGWPAPEFTQNVNRDLTGNLSLSAWEEENLVAFMKALTDGYPIWGLDPRVPPGTPSPYVR